MTISSIGAALFARQEAKARRTLARLEERRRWRRLNCGRAFKCGPWRWTVKKEAQ